MHDCKPVTCSIAMFITSDCLSLQHTLMSNSYKRGSTADQCWRTPNHPPRSVNNNKDNTDHTYAHKFRAAKGVYTCTKKNNHNNNKNHWWTLKTNSHVRIYGDQTYHWHVFHVQTSSFLPTHFKSYDQCQRQHFGKLLKDAVEPIWAFPQVCRYHLELNWHQQMKGGSQ